MRKSLLGLALVLAACGPSVPSNGTVIVQQPGVQPVAVVQQPTPAVIDPCDYSYYSALQCQAAVAAGGLWWYGVWYPRHYHPYGYYTSGYSVFLRGGGHVIRTADPGLYSKNYTVVHKTTINNTTVVQSGATATTAPATAAKPVQARDAHGRFTSTKPVATTPVPTVQAKPVQQRPAQPRDSRGRFTSKPAAPKASSSRRSRGR